MAGLCTSLYLCAVRREHREHWIVVPTYWNYVILLTPLLSRIHHFYFIYCNEPRGASLSSARASETHLLLKSLETNKNNEQLYQGGIPLGLECKKCRQGESTKLAPHPSSLTIGSWFIHSKKMCGRKLRTRTGGMKACPSVSQRYNLQLQRVQEHKWVIKITLR